MPDRLEWKSVGIGRYEAHATIRTYRIGWLDSRQEYCVTVDGYPIGTHGNVDGAKALAQAHRDR